MSRAVPFRRFLPHRSVPTSASAGGGGRVRTTLRWLALPVAVVVVLVLAAVLDIATHGQQVLRNVDLAGVPIGGQSDDDLRTTLQELEPRLAGLPVELRADDQTVATTAGAAGLHIDPEATVADAKDTGRDGLLSPLSWIGGLVAHRKAPLRMNVDDATLAEALRPFGSAGDDPVRFEVNDDGLISAVGGDGGKVVDLEATKSELLHSAAHADNPIRADLRITDAAPVLRADEMAAMAADANEQTSDGLALVLDGVRQRVDAATVRSWLRPDVENRSFTVDGAAAIAAIRGSFPSAGGEGSDAVLVVFGGSPVIVGGEPDSTCCTADTGDRVLAALRAGQDTVNLELDKTERAKGKAWAEGLGVKELVGEFTTRYPAGQPRVTNIKRIAELTQGALVPPGETFSINDFIGPRTTEKGFVAAGSIQNGVFEDSIGGGISQYATTLFNAAFFAGLDYGEYQSHSIYINRYPFGREATVSFPKPDLKIVNSTPYGILVWPTATDTSITVQLYSTKYATGAQTNQTQRPQGAACTKVTTERTRTYVDGRAPVVDSVIALYRPEGVKCSGDPTVATVPTTTTVPPPTTPPPPTEPPTTPPPPTEPPPTEAPTTLPPPADTTVAPGATVTSLAP
jgi:vancomycin resistance protein YoaR